MDRVESEPALTRPASASAGSGRPLPPGEAFPGWTPRFAEALQRLSIPHRQRAGGYRAGDARSAIRGRALEFADYRPYVSGDDPRLVDWRAYARLGRLFLKQQEEERARSVTVLVDASASMDYGEGDAHKGRFARRVAAAIVWIATNRHERVTVYILQDRTAHQLQPVTSRTSLVPCFRELAEVRETGGSDLTAAVRQALSISSRGPTVLISDLLEPGWREALAAVGTTGEAAIVQPLAASEWEPPVGEEVELLDAESGLALATRLGAPELAAYAQRLEVFLADLRRECRRLSIAYAALNTESPLQEVVFRELAAAGIVASRI